MSDRRFTYLLALVLAALVGRLFADTQFSLATLLRFHAADAGAELALPREVLDARAAVAAAGLTQVRFAGRFAPEVDMTLHQRATEYLYPVRNVHDAEAVLLTAGDAMPGPACEVLAAHGATRVVRCG